MRTRVKICGITRPADALAAAAHGADAIGLVFYAPSPRAVSIQQAADIVAGLPPFMSTVGLFVDADATQIAEVLAAVPLDLLQFHGQETPAACAAAGRPWFKAVRMRPGVDPAAEAARYQAGRGVLVDSYRPGVPGGTGETFDWARIPAALAPQLVLAGGLTPDNVTAAIRAVRPWAVDVSGGVEQDKGIKDHDKIQAFMRAVRRGDDAI